MKKIIFLVSIFLISLGISANENQTLIKQANQAYVKQNYEKAIELYKKVILEGYHSFELYYNLGNAYFKNNEIPYAILYYEKARKLNPTDEDLDYNLKVANSRITDKIDVLPQLFIKKWGRNVVTLFSADVWAKFCVISFILVFGLLLLYLFSRSILYRKIAFWFSIFMLLIAASSFYFARLQYNDNSKLREAIIFTPVVNIKSSPDDSGTDIFVVHEGLKVRISNQIDDWYEINIPNGSKGWLKISDVQII